MPVSPPRPKGPPLNALRAFEAAARFGNFARAAEELCVTPGAVAQQVKALEDWAGAALFERRAQGVRLTALGRAVGPELGAAFDSIAAAANLLRRIAAPNEVRAAALPSVAQLWLSPRLPEIRRSNPGLAISVTAMERPPNLLREPFDIAFFFGADEAQGLHAVPLAEDALFPVCAPQIAARLKTPADLARETLLHDSAWRDDWSTWLAAARVGGVPASQGPVFSLYSLAVEEAIHGAGVVIGHAPLVEAPLAAGTLVAPFDLRVPTRAPLCASLRAAGEGHEKSRAKTGATTPERLVEQLLARRVTPG